MAGGDGPGSGRGKFFRRLFRGLQQPPAEPRAQASSERDGDIVRGGGEEPLARFNPAMQRRLPPGMAELLVCPPQQVGGDPQRFRLRVQCCCASAEDLNVEYGGPDLDLGTNIAPGGPPPARFLDTVGNWSYDKGELANWLNQRRHRHQDKLELVVWDDTRFRIPWELLLLPADRELGLPRGHLGGLVTVTRWMSMKPWFPRYVRRFTNPNPYQASGPVVAYIADDMEHDRDILGDFVVHDARGVENLFEILAGEEILARDPAAFAMVYVACHGEFGDDPGDCVLGGFPLGRAGRFSDDLPKLREQPTLVFLNGCRTGAIGLDTRKYNDGALRGFAAVFLRCGATGVLATTGAVGREEAGALAHVLIGHLKVNRDLTVADAVRRLRAAASRRILELLRTDIPEDERRAADEELLSLLYPFMYVYFGSPRMLMSFAQSGGLAGTGELAGTGG